MEVAEATGYGPEIMTLTVQDINTRAWELYESVGFKLIKNEAMLERELPSYPGRIVPAMVNKHYSRMIGAICTAAGAGAGGGAGGGGGAGAGTNAPGTAVGADAQTLVLHDKAFARHDMGDDHPESPDRYIETLAALHSAYVCRPDAACFVYACRRLI